MEGVAIVISTLGALLLVGLLADVAGRAIGFPRVTILVLAGLLFGPPGLDWLPSQATDWYPLVSDIALLMVGFLLGRKLSRKTLDRVGREVVAISVVEVLGVAAIVFGGLMLIGAPLPVAMILAGIGPASAPAAVQNVVEESRAEGPFTDTVLGIVAVDDAWGLVVFSLLLATAGALAGDGGAMDVLKDGGRELGGAIGVGLVLGVPAAFAVRWVRSGDPMEAEALGLVLLAGGLALWMEASFILAAMVMGACIVNLAARDSRPFQAIEKVEWPIMVLFFILAGAEAKPALLLELGVIGGAYVVLRSVGLIMGAWIGAKLGGAPKEHGRWVGPAILPQAGVALGMALVAGTRFPELKDQVVAIVVGSTVLFELGGPIMTRLALRRMNEANDG